MLKFGRFVTKYKKIILTIALILLIPSFIGMQTTKINYDILVYLPEEIETIQGENILKEDFGIGSYSMIIVNDMKAKDILKLEESLRKIGNVGEVISASDILGTSIPTEMLSDELREKIYKEDSTIIFATFKDAISSDETLSTIEQIRNITDARCKIGGMSATILDTRNLSDSEVLVYVVIAVILCLLVLELALDSYIVPIILLLNIGIAVLYNMGSNVIFGEISYITKAISAVLQLGVTMDFAIFLYHSYKAEKKCEKDKDEAMSKAISKTLVSVLGSATTTIAGFLALCTMNLTLGKDIGLVMAKGVAFGLICVVTVLPSMVLLLDKLIEKTSHKEILPKFKKLTRVVIKHYKLIIAIFIVMLPFAIYGYNNTKVYYNLDKSLPGTLSSVEANNTLKEEFGIVSTELLLVDKDMPDYKANEMINEIEKLDGIEWVMSFSKISEGRIPIDVVPERIRNILQSDKYQLMIINSEYEMATNELNMQVEKVNEIVKKYDKDAILAGEGPLMTDLVKISAHDFNSVNGVSIAIIFVIMIFTLKSISLPVILLAVIEFAIFINMGIPAYTGTIIPFIASIVIGTIQLGATIDYAILITTKYIGFRKENFQRKEAVQKALQTSVTSIIVSGLCFFGATFGVGVFSKIEMIGSLCTLMSRGAIISMITVITVLPAFLLAFDKVICKTTAGMKKINN